MNVHVHIERVMLDGVPFGGADQAILARALSGELRRLIEARGIPPALMSAGAIPRLRSAPASMPVAPGPTAAGCSMARAVYASFGRV